MPKPKQKSLPSERCGSCRCYRADPSESGLMLDAAGECLRYPPRMHVLEGGELVSLPVPVDAVEWCGEWRPQIN